MLVSLTSQNVRSFHKDEKQKEFITAMKRRQTYAAVLQESGGFGDTQKDNSGYLILNHGPPGTGVMARGQGVGIILSPDAQKAWTLAGSQVLHFGPRIMAIRLQMEDAKGRPLTIFLGSGYAPHSGRPQAEKDAYAAQFQCCHDTAGPKEVFILGTDTNASLGVRSVHDDGLGVDRDRVRGPFGIGAENEAGRNLHTLLGLNGLCSADTFFPKPRHATWTHPCSKVAYKLDHFIVRQRDMKRVRDAGAVGWRGVDSDHCAVGLRLAIARNLKKQKSAGRPGRIDRRALREPATLEKFVAAAKEHMAAAVAVGATAGVPAPTKLQVLHSVAMAAAHETIWTTARRKPDWYAAAADTLDPLIVERNAAQHDYNRLGRSESLLAVVAKARLVAARTAVKKAIAAAEKVWVDTVLGDVNRLNKGEDDSGRPIDPKQAWDAVRQAQQGMSGVKEIRPMKVRRPDEPLSDDPAEHMKVMVENLGNLFSQQGAFDPDVIGKVPLRRLRPWMDNAPTMEEISKALSAKVNGKAADDSGVSAELLKALGTDPDTQLYLYEVVGAYWRSGSYLGEQPSEKLVDELRKPTVAIAKAEGWRVSYEQVNPKRAGATCRERYEGYKSSATIAEAVANGASGADISHDLKYGFLKLHDPYFAARGEPGVAASDAGALVYEDWLSARLKLLPKKGDLTLCKNWRAICLLDVASKVFSTVLVARMQRVMEEEGLESQTGFRGLRGVIDGIFATTMGLRKRKEHGLETYALFIDLVKAFDTVPRDALFRVLRRFGMPDHFVDIVIRLHFGAKVKVKIGEVDSEIDSSIGVRQGSCEGPVLFLFIMQAAMETMEWPAGVERPQFSTRVDGVTTGEDPNRKRGATTFELWASMFADDCALFFSTRRDFELGTQRVYDHLKRFGLQMHVGRGAEASKTEAMFFPAIRGFVRDRAPQGPLQPTSTAFGDTSRFTLADGGFVMFVREFKYLGSIIHFSLTSDADVNARIKSATSIFGALRDSILCNKGVDLEVKGRVYVALVLSILLYGSESWSLRADLFQRLRSFHNYACRSMCRITMAHTIRHHIKSETLHQRLGLHSVDRYYHNRLLQWGGHIARMSMDRLPRMILTGWVAHPRPTGCPQMTFGRTLNNALKQKGITTKFGGSDGWCAIAQDRQRWLELTNPKPPPRARPPRANPPNVATTAPPPPPPPAPPPGTAPVPANGPRRSARLHGNAAENAAAQQIGDNFIY